MATGISQKNDSTKCGSPNVQRTQTQTKERGKVVRSTMVSSRRTSSICYIISRAAELRDRDDCAPHARREEDLDLFGVYRDVPPIGAPHRDVKQQSIPGAPVESLDAVAARGGDGRCRR